MIYFETNQKQKIIYLSEFGLNKSNSAKQNTKLLQEAIKRSEGKNIILKSDISYLEITSEINSIFIKDSITLDFDNNVLKVYPKVAKLTTNDCFIIAPENNDCIINFKNIKVKGADERGFDLDGTQDVDVLPDTNFIHGINGTLGITHNVNICNVHIDKSTYFNGVILFNGSKVNLSVKNCTLSSLHSSAIGVFGIGSKAYIEKCTFNKSGFYHTEIAGNIIRGVSVYFQNHITGIVKDCEFNNSLRAIQWSSGTYFSGSKWDYASAKTTHQIIDNCRFSLENNTMTGGVLIKLGWLYTNPIVKNCTFNSRGDSIQILNSAKIENCMFSNETDRTITIPSDSANLNKINKIEINNCKIESKSILYVSNTGDNLDRYRIITFDNCEMKPVNYAFNLSSIQNTLNNKVFININNSFLFLSSVSLGFFNGANKNFNAHLKIKDTIINADNSSYKAISLSEYSTDNFTGSLEFDSCKFLTKNLSQNFFWITGDINLNIKFKFNVINSEFDENKIIISNITSPNINGFGISLKNNKKLEIISTDYLPISWNYNKYICNSQNLSNIYFNSNSNSNAGTHLDPFKILKGSLYIEASQGGCILLPGGNIDISNNIIINEYKTQKLEFNRLTKKWEL